MTTWRGKTASTPAVYEGVAGPVIMEIEAVVQKAVSASELVTVSVLGEEFKKLPDDISNGIT